MTEKTNKSISREKENSQYATVHPKTEHWSQRLSVRAFRLLQRMSHRSKALRNVGLYTIKQKYLNENKMATTKEIDSAMKADMNDLGMQSNSVQAVRRTLKHRKRLVEAHRDKSNSFSVA